MPEPIQITPGLSIEDLLTGLGLSTNLTPEGQETLFGPEGYARRLLPNSTRLALMNFFNPYIEPEPEEPAPDPVPEPTPQTYDPNVVYNEVIQQLGRQLTQGEREELARRIGWTGGLLTQEQRDQIFREIAPYIQQQQQPAGIDPSALHSELIALLGRQMTQPEMTELARRIGYTGGQLTEQHRTDALAQVRQYMQGLPVTPQGGDPNLAAPAADTQTDQVRQQFNPQALNTELNRKGFNFNVPQFGNRNFNQLPVARTGIPYQGGVINTRDNFNTNVGRRHRLV